MITKQFSVEDLKVDSGSREVVAVISTDCVDRDREVVLPKGLQKKQYAGNPVVMVNHDYKSLPIGVARWIKTDGNKIISKYYISDKTAFANDVFGLLQDGVLRSHSIGFNTLEASPPSDREIKSRPDWADARMIHRKWELLEFSVVGVPANPEALALAVAKNYHPDTLAFLGKAFQPEPIEPDCWEWVEKKSEPVVEKQIRQPTYCRKWDISAELQAAIKAATDREEIMAMLKGKA